MRLTRPFPACAARDALSSVPPIPRQLRIPPLRSCGAPVGMTRGEWLPTGRMATWMERIRNGYSAKDCVLQTGRQSMVSMKPAACRGNACLFGMGPPVYAAAGGPRSRGADRFPAASLVEDSAALRALDDVRCQAHQLLRLNLVTAKRAGKREVEVGLSFEARCHRPTRPSAVLTGLRIIRCESRPRKTSDGK
jgi:hypothetical protein